MQDRGRVTSLHLPVARNPVSPLLAKWTIFLTLASDRASLSGISALLPSSTGIQALRGDVGGEEANLRKLISGSPRGSFQGHSLGMLTTPSPSLIPINMPTHTVKCPQIPLPPDSLAVKLINGLPAPSQPKCALPVV